MVLVFTVFRRGFCHVHFCDCDFNKLQIIFYPPFKQRQAKFCQVLGICFDLLVQVEVPGPIKTRENYYLLIW